MTNIQQRRDEWNAIETLIKEAVAGEMTLEKARAVLNDLPAIQPIGRLSTQRLSETLWQWSLHALALYGSDTQAMVDATLSEFMVTVSHTLNIVERQRIALDFLKKFENFGLSERDYLMLKLDVLNEAGNDRIVWEAEVTPGGAMIMRSKLAR